jgi:cation transport regulator ChaC
MDSLWYFAYGSNLDPGTFVGRRRMQPLEARAGRLDHYELCFDLPVGPGERGVGNLRSRRDAFVWGVLYRLAAADCERLDRSEGVHRGAYRREPVTVLDAEDAPIEAFTYCSPWGRAGRKPSRRYLALLLAGARHHALPANWLEHLRSFALAVDERDAQLELGRGTRRP